MHGKSILFIKRAVYILSIAYACVTAYLAVSLGNVLDTIHGRFDGIIIDIHSSKAQKPRVFSHSSIVSSSSQFGSSNYVQSTLNGEKEPRSPPSYDGENTTTFELYRTNRSVDVLSENQESLENSAYYDKPSHNPLQPYKNFSECTPMHPWQKESFPTCNQIHESVDFTQFNTRIVNNFNSAYISKVVEDKRLLAHGYFRDSYLIFDKEARHARQPITFKTLRFRRRYDAWTLDRHRMDALVMERMTASDNIIDIYGYCGTAGLFEFATGDMYNVLGHRLSGKDEIDFLPRLRFALDIATAIADLHSIESRGNSSAIVHADIHSTQFLWVSDRFKLNDFNRCHFMYWNQTNDKKTCPYIYLDENAGTFRSPEEYAYSFQTEKIDVYSMGNLFYFLLTGKEPFESLHYSSKRVKDMIKNGTRPVLVNRKSDSAEGPIVNAIIKAIQMCHVQGYEDRATAVTVRDFLISKMNEISS